jgi:thiamine-monophosphate kinase
MNEFQLIDLIKKMFNAKLIGDDTAFLKNQNINLISKDILVEDVHFKIDNNCFEIGAKSLISNISDIISSGGKPKFFFLGLGIPEYLSEAEIKTFLNGIKKISKKYKVTIAGGDISKAEKFFISITIVGTTYFEKPILRNEAQKGDYIYITGNLGDSEIGLRLILNKIKIENKILENYFIKKHYFQNLYPKFVEQLCKKCKINAMIDISDGFLQDLSHILKSSKKSAEIYGKIIPKSNNYKKLKNILQDEYFKIPLFSGEEYQLIFTSPENPEKIKNIAKKFKVKTSKVGKILNKKKELIKILDMFEKFDNLGYRHFS